MIVRFYKKLGWWRWAIRACNGRTISRSAREFQTRRACERSFWNFAVDMSGDPSLHKVDRRPPAMTRPVDILLAVSTATGYSLGDLRGPRRYGQIVRARFAAAWLLRVLCSQSYPQIGAALGGRDHQTAINAVRRVAWDIRDDGPLAHYLADVIGAMTLGASLRDMDILRQEAFA